MRVLLRCDGGGEIGVGHVVRSLALAEEALGRGHAVALLGSVEGPLLVSLTAGVAGLQLLGPPGPGTSLADVAFEHDVVHVDHYDVRTDALPVPPPGPGDGRVVGPLLSVMADGRFGARPADLLVDPTVGAEREEPPAPARWHLRGSRFTPVRRSFRARATENGARPTGAGADEQDLPVLVVMGGTDPAGCAPLVVEALGRLDLPLDVTVVAAPGTVGALTGLRRTWRRGRLDVIEPATDLPERMARAAVVITAAGTSTWELCALRRPMALVAAVDNQQAGHDRVVAAGAAVGLGGRADLADVDATSARLRGLLTEPTMREHLAEAAHRLVDGLGAWRVVSAWESALSASAPRPDAPAVTVRPATLDDAGALLEWRNDPVTLAVSRQHDPVRPADHLAWLSASLSRSDRLLLVGSSGGTEIGTVRWDRVSDGEWEVSITVARDARGRGVAGPLLRAGEEWLSGAVDVAACLAVVHRDNQRSRRLFVSSGYVPDLPADGAGFERWVRAVRRGPT
jgi:spore coat polysaccharide biosynthesis predicted glycosyltransferase SpsG/RimJ/RimL family protein N-acetyltransferase